MKWNKNDWRGTRQVLVFTFCSLFKGKASLVTLVVFLVFGLLAPPVFFLFGGSADGVPAATALSKVTVYNETDLDFEPEEIAAGNSYFSSVVFQTEEKAAGADPAGDLLSEEAAAWITSDEPGDYRIRVYAGLNTNVSSDDLDLLTALLEKQLQKAEYAQAGFSDSQIELLTANYSTDIGNVSDYLSGEKDDEESSGYGIQLAYAIVVLMVSILAVNYIIRTIVEEKASKLVEMLLLNVRPLALVAGKILAILAYVFSVLILFLFCLAISCGFSSKVLGTPGPGELMKSAAVQFGAVNLSAGMIFLMMISLFLGCLTMAVIAGISGAGCSSMDDISGASAASTFLIMAGYFISIIVINIPVKGVILFSSVCPVLSVFCAPVQYIMGNISSGVLMISWLIQAAVVLLLVKFCAKVYKSLIMYRGSRLTWKQMFDMAENRKGRVN